MRPVYSVRSLAIEKSYSATAEVDLRIASIDTAADPSGVAIYRPRCHRYANR